MDPVLLSRVQFGLTVAFHFLFPPISIGLAWLIVYMGWRGLRSGEAVYQQLTRFWVRVLGLVFAAGVATGIPMEFQFGTNWAAYARFVGDIFGSPLAAEGLFAFFLESTFMGVLLFARDRVSPQRYWLASLMVALGATLSGFWIIAANSWQQTPTAYRIVTDGPFQRAELTNFWAAIFNPSTLPRYFHTIIASLLAGSFFVASAGAHYLLQGRHLLFARHNLRLGLTAAAVLSLLLLGIGHLHAVQVALTQPAKLAAFEGLFETQDGAPMSIWGFPDVENRTVRLNLAIPGLLSFLLDFDPHSTVPGLDQFPQDEWPPVATTFYAYHLMVLLGGWFILLPWLGLLLGERRFTQRGFLKAVLYTAPLPTLAIEMGWLAAEFGRQPWVVYGLLRTEDAISATVPAGQILATIVLFVLIYALLLGLFLYLLRQEFQRGPQEAPRHGESAG